MSSPCPRRSAAAVLVLAATLALAGCQRETRDTSSGDPSKAPGGVVQVSTLRPGGGPPPPPSAIGEQYGANAYAISQGKRLFRWFNCSGCHANGGGGMGPALMDDEWRYGDRMDQIYATIDQGRPNGMPAFASKITKKQAWELVAYVRSMSGLAAGDAASGRDDHMKTAPPESTIQNDPPRETGPPPIPQLRH